MGKNREGYGEEVKGGNIEEEVERGRGRGKKWPKSRFFFLKP